MIVDNFYSVESLSERYARGSGPIDVGPAEWFRILRSVELASGRHVEMSEDAWPILFGRELRCVVPKWRRA